MYVCMDGKHEEEMCDIQTPILKQLSIEKYTFKSSHVSSGQVDLGKKLHGLLS